MTIVQFPDYRKDNPYQQLLADALQARSIETIFPEGYRRILPFSRALWSMKGVNVLHLHWPTPYLKGGNILVKIIHAGKLLLDCLLIKSRGIRLVWTVHNLISHDTKTPRLEIGLSRLLTRLADRLIVHSNGARDTVEEEYRAPSDKVAVIPHGSYAGVYGAPLPPSKARAMLGLAADPPVFLFFGMIRPYKGVVELLRVWNATPQLYEHASLVIAGDARDPELANLIDKLAVQAPNVQLHMRFIAYEEVPIFFSAADWVVLPFAQSLTSGTAILAQSFGKPLLAARLEGLQVDTSGDFSDTFEPKNLHALHSALERASGRTRAFREELSKRAAAYKPQDSWTDIARLHAAVYGVEAADRRITLGWQ